jgi:hypothetical protein
VLVDKGGEDAQRKGDFYSVVNTDSRAKTTAGSRRCRRRVAYLGQVSDNLSGVMYLAGHKQPPTTARYLRPQKQAAAEVLDAAATHEVRSQNGRTAKKKERSPARSTGGKANYFKGVRGRGLVPRWLLTASTSS